MTDATPRTDAQKWRYFSDVDSEESMEGVDINFARQLERELAESAERVREAERKLAEAQKDVQRYNQKWRAALAFMEQVFRYTRPIIPAPLWDRVEKFGDAYNAELNAIDAALSGAAPEEKKQ